MTLLGHLAGLQLSTKIPRTLKAWSRPGIPVSNYPARRKKTHMAMGHNLCLHFGADEHPCTTYFDVHQGYRVLTHSHIQKGQREVQRKNKQARTPGRCQSQELPKPLARMYPEVREEAYILSRPPLSHPSGGHTKPVVEQGHHFTVS